MWLALLDRSGWDFNVETPYHTPLGGSHSCLCYLAEQLALAGQQVALLTFTSSPGAHRGVKCLSLQQPLSMEWVHSLDACIVLNSAHDARALRQQLAPRTRLILWTQHAHDQPAMQPLHDPLERDAFDAIVLISEWQRQQFHANFGLDPAKTHILRNAIAPCFENLFPEQASILTEKTNPPVLAYTSTPFRGLHILVEVFPRIRAAVPGTTLKVFSSMQVYQVSKAEDHNQYGNLYQLCRQTEGVEYIGSLPQPELARQLRSASVFAYPNIFQETCCIAALEAMASGCSIVTSDLGALPETTAGFGRLIPILGDEGRLYKDRFVEETVDVLQTLIQADVAQAEAHLRRQIDYVNKSATWSVRAGEWIEWLSRIVA